MPTVQFQDEAREQSVFKQADYDESVPVDLVLEVPKRTGGVITVPLLKTARANKEREDVQDNTLMRIKPVAELCDDAPVASGGLVTYTGRGVALLRPGYLYVFRGNTLWRELEIAADGRMSDIDLASYRSAADAGNAGAVRASEGVWSGDLLIPAFLQGQGVMHNYRIAYSEVQWSWARIRYLETHSSALNKRTSSVGPAYAAVQPDTPQDSLTFARGFPAQRVSSMPPLRKRDLGIELMLEQPADFTPDFETPDSDALCQRLANRLKSLDDENGGTPDLDIQCKPEDDVLADSRNNKGMVCAAVPDVLFQVRHALAQIHLALQYLNVIDISLKGKPLTHSAMLIRQAVFDARPDGTNPLASYRDAVNLEKLNEVLQTDERDYAAKIINTNVSKLKSLMEDGRLDAALDDYRTLDNIGVCEAYSLCADQLNVLQQVPGILAAQGLEDENQALAAVKRWIGTSEWLDTWAPESGTEDSSDEASLYTRLQRLTADQTTIADKQLNYLHLQSLAVLEKQVQQVRDDQQPTSEIVKEAGQTGALVKEVLGQWSSALLATTRRIIEEDGVTAIHLPRVMQGAVAISVLTDSDLEGIQVMRRGEVDLTRHHIIGVYGEGLNYGLTDFDRTEGLLKRGKDYLYADLLNEGGDTLASTSPQRAAEQVEDGIKKVAMDTWVFTVPAGHPAARKLSLFKVNLAKRVGAIVDGPGVSRSLVAFAVFNVFVESNNAYAAYQSDQNLSLPSAKAITSLIDLTAASMKLKIITVNLAGREIYAESHFYRISNRLLFDLKSVPLIGTRLIKVGASTLVRTASAVSFVSGVLAVGISFWDMNSFMSRGDNDAAQGHAIAMVGGTIFLAAPLMAGLLAIPGWGWAVLGISMAVGGSLLAGQAADDRFERTLKNGPLGIHPMAFDPMPTDADYYGQLLSILTPIQATAQRYGDITPDSALGHSNPDYAPQPDDYVITLSTPLVSLLTHSVKGQPGEPWQSFNIIVQEVAYTESQISTGNAAIGTVEQSAVSKITPLTQITARQSLPTRNAVRFLVKRNLKGQSFDSFAYRATVSISVRITIQAAIGTEAGTVVYPTPALEAFVPYNPATNGRAPTKEPGFLNPYANTPVPYWFVTEVEV